MRIQALLVVAASVWGLTAAAQAPRTLDESLRLYQVHGDEFLRTIPQKYTTQGEALDVGTRFSENAVKNRTYIGYKLTERKACKQDAANDGSRSSLALKGPRVLEEIDGKNQPHGFFEDPNIESNLLAMDRQNLFKAELEHRPWSGHYWPYAFGALGARVYDPGFRSEMDWKGRLDYVQENSVSEILASGTQEQINQLSPSEKYSLLIGDQNHAFTDRQWQFGKKYYDRYGEVEEWMGLCHGWAPASIVTPRPVSDLEVLAADGKTLVHLKPEELKALATFQWATNSFQTRFLGARCNAQEDDVDENGRIRLSRCRDVNAGAWHTVVVNQIGLMNESFIIDVVYDYQVWNQPVISYEYKYYDLRTKEPVESLEQARIPVNEFTDDPYEKYRSPAADTIVGVAMQITYVSEGVVSRSNTSDPSMDSHVSVNYIYDLELDAQGEIIGGEWHTQAHPDFIWKPAQGAKAWSRWDSSLTAEQWDDQAPLPQSWRRLGQRAASQQGAILGRLVDKLIVQANSTADEVDTEPAPDAPPEGEEPGPVLR